ncbi:unnamed protein product [Mytilus coruscus]|uniref:TRPM SLOG domain-containing protein n=1 Tax=Mytilus coruscus TaxID=42192 RepID=A0A6J8DN49_MYTCO|nr:unnamed protein product [Mytilus coruscus]
MTTIGNSKSLKFSKYFPNHLEYASRVYKDNLKNRGRKKRPTPVDSIQEHSSTILDPTDLEVTHPEVKISATETEAVDIIQTFTQTDDKSVQEIVTQTEKEIVPHNQKQTPNPPPKESNIDNPDFHIDPPKIWNDLRRFGEPRIVVSVIGCGFIYQEEKTNIVQSVVYKSDHIEGLPRTYGFFAVHLFDDAKEVTENRGQHIHDTSCDLKEVKALLEIENYINSKEKVWFEDVQQESDMRPKIRVPVALLVLNGDLDTLEHVLRAIYSDMSVVVVKGTGGAADLIALCLEE